MSILRYHVLYIFIYVFSSHVKQMCCAIVLWNHVAQKIFLQITYYQMKKRQWYLRCWYSGDTDTTVVFSDVNLQTLLSSKSPLQRCRDRIPFLREAIKYYYDGSRQYDFHSWCSEDIAVLNLAIGIFQEIHASLSSNSFTLCKLWYFYSHYLYMT